MEYSQFQEELLAPLKDIPEKIKDAFRKIPRHLFIKRFSLDGERWTFVKKDNLEILLPLLYTDTTLLLYEKEEKVSTISQPSFVLRMLDLLDIKKGQKIFELGAGSGWNAALLGELVGPEGKVVSVEIIDEMARISQENLSQFNLPQVEILKGDGSFGYPSLAPFDRGVFTAGAYDIPDAFYDQIKEEGKLLFVLKTPTRGDLLLVLRKKDDHFEEEQRLRCQFVSLTGESEQVASSQMDQLLGVGRMKIYRKDKLPEINYRERIIQGVNSLFVF